MIDGRVRASSAFISSSDIPEEDFARYFWEEREGGGRGLG